MSPELFEKMKAAASTDTMTSVCLADYLIFQEEGEHTIEEWESFWVAHWLDSRIEVDTYKRLALLSPVAPQIVYCSEDIMCPKCGAQWKCAHNG